MKHALYMHVLVNKKSMSAAPMDRVADKGKGLGRQEILYAEAARVGAGKQPAIMGGSGHSLALLQQVRKKEEGRRGGWLCVREWLRVYT